MQHCTHVAQGEKSRRGPLDAPRGVPCAGVAGALDSADGEVSGTWAAAWSAGAPTYSRGIPRTAVLVRAGCDGLPGVDGGGGGESRNLVLHSSSGLALQGRVVGQDDESTRVQFDSEDAGIVVSSWLRMASETDGGEGGQRSRG